jgi:4-amino-4-deoxychorismate lyase
MSHDVASTLVNGQSATQIASADRGVQYGDGLFETIRCEQGTPRWLDRHLARLALGCARLKLALPDAGVLEQEVRSLAAAEPRSLLKIIYTRGVASTRGYAPRAAGSPTRILARYPWPEQPAHWQDNFRVHQATVRLGENPLLAGIKHLNRLEQVLAAGEAAVQGADEVLVASSSGEWICGGMSNLFLIEGERLITPPLARCGVAGIMRALVMESAAHVGLAAVIEPVTSARLAQAPSLFLTNVRLGLQCVHWLAGRALIADPRIVRLQEILDVRS